MNTAEVLKEIGIILAAGLLATPVAALLRIPVMLLLVAAGLAIGPQALGWVSDPLTGEGAQLVFTFGVALILFHGGLGISMRVISRTAVSLAMLVIPGVLLTALLVAMVAGPLLGVSFTVALLVGAVLAPTDPAILIPLFERLGLRPKVSQTIIAESAFNDPTGTVLALAVASAVGTAGGLSIEGLLSDFGTSMALGAVAGLMGGALLALMLSENRWGLWREAPLVPVMSLVAVGYFTAEHFGGSAYLAAFIMGLIVGNLDLLGLRRAQEHERLMEPLMNQLTEIATIGVFVTLGVNLPLDAVQRNLWPGIALMAFFIFVARPVTVLVCASWDRRARWSGEELAFLSWSRETGVVPAALAGLLVARGVEGADVVAAMVALAILATLMLQATTAGIVARRLGLVGPPEAAAHA